jgi:DNA-binding transcriptional LysR family regulator
MGLAECLAIASHGLGVYCVPDSVPRFYSRPDLVFRSVVDATPAQVVVIGRRDAQNPAVGSFFEIARAVATRDPVVTIHNDSF